MGNIIVTAVWKVCADKTKEPKVIAFAQRLVTITDIAFTLVGFLLLMYSGPILAKAFGGIKAVYWISAAFKLLMISGAIWLFVLVPIQFKQSKLAKEFKDGGEIPPLYWTLGKVWSLAGFVATVLPLLGLYLMVAKPTL